MLFRQSSDGFDRDLADLRRQVADLKQTLAAMSGRGAASSREVAQQYGRRAVQLGEGAGDMARRHPAVTGATLLALAGVAACLAVYGSDMMRRR